MNELQQKCSKPELTSPSFIQEFEPTFYIVLKNTQNYPKLQFERTVWYTASKNRNKIRTYFILFKLEFDSKSAELDIFDNAQKNIICEGKK